MGTRVISNNRCFFFRGVPACTSQSIVGCWQGVRDTENIEGVDQRGEISGAVVA